MYLVSHFIRWLVILIMSRRVFHIVWGVYLVKHFITYAWVSWLLVIKIIVHRVKVYLSLGGSVNFFFFVFHKALYNVLLGVVGIGNSNHVASRIVLNLVSCASCVALYGFLGCCGG